MFLLLGFVLTSLLLAPSASAKEVIAYFGTESGSGTAGGQFESPGDIAVNSTGAGSADSGDVYVVDEGNSRIQRFALDDAGTPANPYDDSYSFISAWGADVDGSASGGQAYEVCLVATSCQAGVPSGGNGSAAGNGSLASRPEGIAVDQDSGNVYVTDRGNSRVNVYAGDGTFLRSFGFDVVASGPGETGTGFEICVSANGDVCKAGVAGAGIGQIGGSGFIGAAGIALSNSDGNPNTGSVFLADQANSRVNAYALDGTSPSSFGSAANFGTSGPVNLAVDSRGILYAEGGDQTSNWIVARYDSQNANGGGVGFLGQISIPPLLTQAGGQVNAGLEIDPDSDGVGADSDVLYALRGLGSTANSVVQQFGPLNSPGLTTAPPAVDAIHGSVAAAEFATGLGFDAASGRLFASSSNVVNGEPPKSGVYVLDTAGGAPSASLDAVSDITVSGAKLHATVQPNGPPDVSYRIEYSTDGANWTQEPRVLVGSQENPQSIEITFSPPGAGLQPSTLYHVRLSVEKVFTAPVITTELSFTTLADAPRVETIGAPVRTTTTAQLGARVNPRGKATTFHFEYGDDGPCDANVCATSAPISVGSGNVERLTSTEIVDLKPNTTYHYRVVAENGAPGSPTFGEDMTVTTRASEAPLDHGAFPGPPGSDRAYEMVSVADSSGNPVFETQGFSPDGNRAIYSIAGGTPISDTGNLSSFYFAERGVNGWQTKNITPPRNELVGALWSVGGGPEDHSTINIRNTADTGENTFWRLFPDAAAERVFDFEPPTELVPPESVIIVSATEAKRTVAQLQGGALDPAHPAAASVRNLYDVSSGAAELVSLLPGDTLAPCGSGSNLGAFMGAVELSSDGRWLIFPSQGAGPCGSAVTRLYIRDLEAGTTSLLTPPVISGPECGSGSALRLTEDAFFFWTRDRLSAEDTAPDSCPAAGSPPDGDVYRYELDGGALECVTCVLPGLDADVRTEVASPAGAKGHVTVSHDGSRIYFSSAATLPLLPGATTGGQSTYVVNTESGNLRWVGAGIVSGEIIRTTADGAAALFRSNASSLNPLGGASDNGGTTQLYRYDDRDRSIACVSCPQDGSAAANQVWSNIAGISADGQTTGFSTPVALSSGDQNTPKGGGSPARGTDVYEWRDGRLFLITDGLTDWPSFGEPKAVGLSPSGRDLYFTAFAQLTPDAIDAYNRVYDARIGGGFEYPKPPPPCPLEVCQGTPKGAPEEQAPGTGNFVGPGNKKPAQRASRCPKGKRKVQRGGKARCVKPAKKKRKGKRANKNRRAAR
jgi:sugar lactone lactonase YvrE